MATYLPNIPPYYVATTEDAIARPQHGNTTKGAIELPHQGAINKGAKHITSGNATIPAPPATQDRQERLQILPGHTYPHIT